MTEAEIAAARAESAAAKERGFDGWRVICSAQKPAELGGNYDRENDHLANSANSAKLWGRYAPWPNEKLGAWAPVLEDNGQPVLCGVCGAPLVRTPLPF